MFNEKKVKKDLERMRKAYDEALKKLEDIEGRQKEIARLIYKARKSKNDKQ